MGIRLLLLHSMHSERQNHSIVKYDFYFRVVLILFDVVRLQHFYCYYYLRNASTRGVYWHSFGLNNTHVVVVVIISPIFVLFACIHLQSR